MDHSSKQPLSKAKSTEEEYLHGLKTTFINKVAAERPAFRRPYDFRTPTNLRATSTSSNDLRVGVELKNKPKFSILATKAPTTASLRRGECLQLVKVIEYCFVYSKKWSSNFDIFWLIILPQTWSSELPSAVPFSLGARDPIKTQEWSEWTKCDGSSSFAILDVALLPSINLSPILGHFWVPFFASKPSYNITCTVVLHTYIAWVLGLPLHRSICRSGPYLPLRFYI